MILPEAIHQNLLAEFELDYLEVYRHPSSKLLITSFRLSEWPTAPIKTFAMDPREQAMLQPAQFVEAWYRRLTNLVYQYRQAALKGELSQFVGRKEE